ncbi:uncharacterized protein LOC129903304 [Solanum dulcamara]|uniref:uncharacterized protein LOC129903304 n=1 Tax=Solanum dulcamara TaxID=45834 RepID=UPI0024866458|nr:uncharacterized protein LOC129903304 [Solanum dulcamara]
MKENQELSHKQVEYEFQDSIKNDFGFLSMVDDGDKIGNFFDSTTMKVNEEFSHKQSEYQYQHSIKNFVEDRDFFIESKKLGLSGREKLKRHWREVGGRFFVPDRWEHEGSLREWMDCSSFDKILAPKGLKSAREALMSQGEGVHSGSTSTSRMLKVTSR